jgi:hypothetical protein
MAALRHHLRHHRRRRAQGVPQHRIRHLGFRPCYRRSGSRAGNWCARSKRPKPLSLHQDSRSLRAPACCADRLRNGRVLPMIAAFSSHNWSTLRRTVFLSRWRAARSSRNLTSKRMHGSIAIRRCSWFARYCRARKTGTIRMSAASSPRRSCAPMAACSMRRAMTRARNCT